jgi:hypothetical protein
MKALRSAMVAGAAWLGCVAAAVPTLAQDSRQTTGAAQGPSAAPAGHAGMMMGMGSAVPAPAAEKISGTVLESISTAGYTYLRLKTASGEEWAAISGDAVAVGSAVTIAVSMRAENFESKSLNRTFERLSMGALAPAEASASARPPESATLLSSHAQPAPVTPPGGMPAGHPALGADRSLAGPEQLLPRADGARGRTVAEVWKQSGELKDTQVAVRGRVVKSLTAIMGRNWLHLRDGSGSAATGDDDITVTTTATVAVGDVVVVTGTIRVNRDFGSGYSYPVLIEDATVAK